MLLITREGEKEGDGRPGDAPAIHRQGKITVAKVNFLNIVPVVVLLHTAKVPYFRPTLATELFSVWQDPELRPPTQRRMVLLGLLPRFKYDRPPMQVPKINAAVSAFGEWLTTEAAEKYLPLFETQQNWQNHFNVEAKNLADVYDLALDSKTNRRHYRRSGYDPKTAMLAILRTQTEFARDAFRDLFSEDRDIEGRVGRFEFFINELWNRYRDAHPKDRTPDHYHRDDYAMASIYLMGQHPAVYAPYSTELLQNTCTQLGAKTVPEAADFARYVKLLQTLRTFLVKDETVVENYTKLLREGDYAEESALLVYLFFQSLPKGEA